MLRDAKKLELNVACAYEDFINRCRGWERAAPFHVNATAGYIPVLANVLSGFYHLQDSCSGAGNQAAQVKKLGNSLTLLSGYLSAHKEVLSIEGLSPEEARQATVELRRLGLEIGQFAKLFHGGRPAGVFRQAVAEAAYSHVGLLAEASSILFCLATGLAHADARVDNLQRFFANSMPIYQRGSD